MNEPYSLTEQQWNVAHAIAHQLALKKIDVNELGKAIAYLRAFGDREDAGVKFFKYLHTLAKNGKHIGHSKKTPDYYKAISQACHQHLKPYQENTADMLQILGWAFRLTRYYTNYSIDNSSPTQKNPPIKKSDRAKHKPKLKLQKTGKIHTKKSDPEGGSGTNLALQRPRKKPKP